MVKVEVYLKNDFFHVHLKLLYFAFCRMRVYIILYVWFTHNVGYVELVLRTRLAVTGPDPSSADENAFPLPQLLCQHLPEFLNLFTVAHVNALSFLSY